MITNNPTRICFLKVTDQTSKLQKLCTIVQTHFIKRDKLLIAAPSHEAATYIDQLLWKMPEDSFIPHTIVTASATDQIAITTSHLNLNQAHILINLLSTPHPNPSPARVIYELLDLTSREKEASSRKKEATYQAMGYQIEET